jgi:hypothetical protein
MFSEILASLDHPAGARFETVPEPHIVARVEEISPSDRILTKERRLLSIAGAYLQETRAKEFVRRVLSAVLEHGGTLAQLEGWSAARQPRVTLHIAKTGTSTLESGAIRDAYVAGGLVLDGRRFSYIALVGTGDPRLPLGRNIHGSSLVPLVQATLESLAGEDAR